MTFRDHHPVIGICGYSGSGKTTLVEQLIPALRARGLAVGVVKHDAHGMFVDREGKDTDRFFRAGAAVVGHDPEQIFFRSRPGDGDNLRWSVRTLLETCDLVLVEGHKDTALPLKIWLQSEGASAPPPEAGPWSACLGRDTDRLAMVCDVLWPWLDQCLAKRPLRAGILIGGGSTRMGRPKQMLRLNGRTWLEMIVAALAQHVTEPCLLGAGPVPGALDHLLRLPDVPGRGGPLAGMLSAMRWDSEAAWVFLPCDMPMMLGVGIDWLLSARRPGVWAIMPQRPGKKHPEPLGAWYDPRMVAALVGCRGPLGVCSHARVITPELPDHLSQTWRSVNKPEEMP